MKKIFALAIVMIASLLAISYIYADVGETEPPANVAPAIIQAPKEPVAPASTSAASRVSNRRKDHQRDRLKDRVPGIRFWYSLVYRAVKPDAAEGKACHRGSGRQ